MWGTMSAAELCMSGYGGRKPEGMQGEGVVVKESI